MAFCCVPLVLGRLPGGPNAVHVFVHGTTEKIGGRLRDQLIDDGVAHGVDVSHDRRQSRSPFDAPAGSLQDALEPRLRG